MWKLMYYEKKRNNIVVNYDRWWRYHFALSWKLKFGKLSGTAIIHRPSLHKRVSHSLLFVHWSYFVSLIVPAGNKYWSVECYVVYRWCFGWFYSVYLVESLVQGCIKSIIISRISAGLEVGVKSEIFYLVWQFWKISESREVLCFYANPVF